MDEFRSKSCKGKTGRGGEYVPTNMQELRSYSASYNNNNAQVVVQQQDMNKMKKSKTSKFGSKKGWSFNDPELQRKTRVASYKVYGVEGKMKGSFKKSFRWVKDTYSQVIYGWK
ncbi:hypothetical protein ACFE04_008528 [Oxalis oulophora]